MERILYSEFSHGKSTQAHFKRFLKKIKIDHHSLNSQLRSSCSHSPQKKAQPKPLSEESDFDCAFVLQALILHSKATHTLLRATSTTSYIGLIYLFLDIFCFRSQMLEEIIASDERLNRVKISRCVCEVFGWYKPDGGLKEMSCRVALLRMERDGLIRLPI